MSNDDKTPISHPSMWSISYAQLMQLEEQASKMDGYSKMTMRDINKYIIEPSCRKTGISYALMLNPQGLPVEAFITHSWDEVFGEFVQSIRKAFDCRVVKPNLWICAMALVQGDSQLIQQQLLPALSGISTSLNDSPFVRALEKSSTFVVVRNSSTDLYSRIWCVCELIYARKYGLVPEKTHVTGPHTFSQLETSCLDAKATIAEDRDLILKHLLLEHDRQEIDDFVRLFRTQQLADAVACLDKPPDNELPPPHIPSIDVYFAMQIPSTTLDHLHLRPKLLSDLHRIETVIKTGSTEVLKQTRERIHCIYLTDAKTKDAEQAFKTGVRLLVWCAEGNDELRKCDEDGELSTDAFEKAAQLPEMVLVCMTFGARHVAQKLLQIGVRTVIWVRTDPFQKTLLNLFSSILLPFCVAIYSDGEKFEKISAGVQKNAQRLDRSCQCGFFSTDQSQSMYNMVGDTTIHREEPIPHVIVKMQCCSTMDWLQSRGLKQLKLDLGDLRCLERVKQYIMMHGENEEPRYLFLHPNSKGIGGTKNWEQARALALCVCNDIAGDGAELFENGIHRITCAADVVSVQKKLERTIGRALIWFDISSEKNIPFSSGEVEDWIEDISDNTTLLLLITAGASSFEWVDNLLSDWSILGDYELLNDSTGLEATVSSYNGVLSILPLEDGGETMGNLKDADELCQSLTRLVLNVSVDDHNRNFQRFSHTKVYHDDDNSTKICVTVGDISQLKRLLDLVYLGTGLQTIADSFGRNIEDVKLDCSAFATCYEKVILQLETLTNHQEDKLSQCMNFERVRVEGGAGTGKTFVGLHLTLDYLHREKDKSKYVLYACHSRALAYHFTKWLLTRFRQEGISNSSLNRIYFLSDDMETPSGFTCHKGVLKEVPLSSSQWPCFGWIVIDEAHSVFCGEKGEAGSSDQYGEKIRQLLQKQKDNKVMLLSDASQALVASHEIHYPVEFEECLVKLTEVCRSSRRVIGGAMSYLSTEGDQISFAHTSDGLPLRSFLFKQTDECNVFHIYAKKVVGVIKEILSSFPGLDLHDRLAIIVPDRRFRQQLCEGPLGLISLLNSHKEELGQHLVPKSALEASRALNWDKQACDDSWVVVDSISEMDGLERLLVIGVGLDNEMGQANGQQLRLHCSRIYRAFTRAHLMFYLVNENVKGGWFEWLNHLDEKSEEFNFQQAAQYCPRAAIDVLRGGDSGDSDGSGEYQEAPLAFLASANGQTIIKKGSGKSVDTKTSSVEAIAVSSVDVCGGGVPLRNSLTNFGVWDTSANERDGMPAEFWSTTSFIPVAWAATVLMEASVELSRRPKIEIRRGSVVGFSHPNQRSAIAFPTNAYFLMGGVHGAMRDAAQGEFDRDVVDLGGGCPTGEARIIGPNTYGDLRVQYLILAVGPDFSGRMTLKSAKEKELELRSAYETSLQLAEEAGIEALAFALISAGNNRGNGDAPFRIALKSVSEYEGYQNIKKIVLYAYQDLEYIALQGIIGNQEAERRCGQ